MKRFSNGDTSVLKQHYEKKVLELEHEKRTLQVNSHSIKLIFIFNLKAVLEAIYIIVITLQKEIEELRHSLANISSTSDEGASKLKEEYLQKLNVLEAQVYIELPCFFNSICSF